MDVRVITADEIRQTREYWQWLADQVGLELFMTLPDTFHARITELLDLLELMEFKLAIAEQANNWYWAGSPEEQKQALARLSELIGGPGESSAASA